MNRILSVTSVSLVALPALADLHPLPTTRRAVADLTNVLDDRGVKLEVYPTRRAIPQLNATTHAVQHHVIAAKAADTIGPRQLGVVFNHAMQQQGSITGEIAFQLKAGLYGGLQSRLYRAEADRRLLGVYVVNAGTPAEFMAVTKRLQGNSSVEWVEPIVQYGPVDGVKTPPAAPAAQ